jgi:hypothetical protein
MKMKSKNVVGLFSLGLALFAVAPLFSGSTAHASVPRGIPCCTGDLPNPLNQRDDMPMPSVPNAHVALPEERRQEARTEAPVVVPTAPAVAPQPTDVPAPVPTAQQQAGEAAVDSKYTEEANKKASQE